MVNVDKLKEIEKLYMKLPMFKESFLPWLEEAKISLNRAKRDYEAKGSNELTLFSSTEIG